MSAAVTPQPSPPTPAPTEAGVGVSHFANAREWLDALGGVPLERILFDPPPGSATVRHLVQRRKEDGRCELVNGTLVKTATNWYASVIVARLVYFIGRVVYPQKLGLLVGSSAAIRLAQNIRRPDIGFYRRATLLNHTFPGDEVSAIVPDLAVEVLSDSNTRREMEIKLAEYFKAGTRLVWYVDPPTRTIAVYTTPAEPQTLTAADRLTAGDVLPGFDVAVADVFDVG